MNRAMKIYTTPKVCQIDIFERDTGLVPFAVAAAQVAAYAAARVVVNAIKIDSLRCTQSLSKVNRNSESMNMVCV